MTYYPLKPGYFIEFKREGVATFSFSKHFLLSIIHLSLATLEGDNLIKNTNHV